MASLSADEFWHEAAQRLFGHFTLDSEDVGSTRDHIPPPHVRIGASVGLIAAFI